MRDDIGPDAVLVTGWGTALRYDYVECILWSSRKALEKLVDWCAAHDEVLYAGWHNYVRDAGGIWFKNPNAEGPAGEPGDEPGEEARGEASAGADTAEATEANDENRLSAWRAEPAPGAENDPAAEHATETETETETEHPSAAAEIGLTAKA